MYYYNLVQALASDGYTRDVDLRGAPYDWRRAPRKFFTYSLIFTTFVSTSSAF